MKHEKQGTAVRHYSYCLLVSLTHLRVIIGAGSITATDGPAEGATSTDIGVSESSSTATGLSMQLVGTGSTYADFTWIADAAQSFGTVRASVHRVQRRSRLSKGVKIDVLSYISYRRMERKLSGY